MAVLFTAQTGHRQKRFIHCTGVICFQSTAGVLLVGSQAIYRGCGSDDLTFIDRGASLQYSSSKKGLCLAGTCWPDRLVVLAPRLVRAGGDRACPPHHLCTAA